MLANKAFCYKWLEQDKEAIRILKDAITEYRVIQENKDRFLSRICRYYCLISSASSDNDFYHSCVMDIYKAGCLYKDEYKFYKEYFWAKYGELEIDQLPKEIEKEEKEINGYFDTFNLLHFEYLKGYVYAYKAKGWNLPYGRSMEGKVKAIPYLENAVKGLKILNGISAKEVLIESYSCLAEIYESLGQNASAAYQLREILSLMSVYWKKLNCKSPWSSLNDKMARFESYTNQLEKAKQDQAIVDYCKTVLDDKRLLEAGDDCYLSVLETLKEAYQRLNNFEEVKRIEKIIFSFKVEKNDTSFNEITSDEAIKLYNEGKISLDDIKKIAHSIWRMGKDFEDFYVLLIAKKDYSTIFSIYSQFVEERKSIELGEIYCSKEDVASKKCSQYDYEIDGERETCHHGDHSGAIWHTYYYLAIVHLNCGNGEEAIKFQQRVLDIVRTDWKFEPDERENILENFTHTHSSIDYLDLEVDMLLQMSYIYLQSNDFDNAYSYCKKATDLNLQILKKKMSSGSQAVKEEAWENRNHVYYSIINNLTDKVLKYPRFGDLILEATIMQKGFLLNLFSRTKEMAYANYQTKKKIKDKDNAEKQIELSCYNQNIDKRSAIVKFQNADILVNGSVAIDSIICQANESFFNVKNRLHNNDILVDYFTKKTEDIIKKERQAKVYNNDNDSVIIAKIYPDSYIYANILRRGWQHPKVVYIGRISDAIRNVEKRDLIDYLFYYNNERDEINALYKNASFSHFIWDKIITEGDIKNGDNIFFIPSGIINRIAIESLPINGNVVSDIYHIYRLSSIRELHHNELLYKPDDRCVAFGDINSYTSLSSNNKRGKRIDRGKAGTMSSKPQAILDRACLRYLSTTGNVIRTISQVINNTKPITGAGANEKAFYELSEQSPETLFLGTHGYNFEMQKLKEQEKCYLFGGRRDVSLTESEKGMYISGLYLAPSNTPEIATDGMLTAKEISMQDLSNTKLAVLSACSTAIGIVSQDGVYGVQRGLKLAGVKSIVASLWEVDQKATQILMKEFFRQYTSGKKNAHEALRLAQLFVRNYTNDSDDDNIIIRGGNENGKIYSNPYFWAGFILID